MSKLNFFSINHDELLIDFDNNDESVYMPAGPNDENRIKIVGTPIGTPEYVAKYGIPVMNDEAQLLNFLPKLASLQIAWLLLYYCALPRINHLLRIIPSSLIYDITHSHDEGIFSLFCSLFHISNERS